MIGTTEEERLALHLSLKTVGEFLEEVGWDTRLAELDETTMLALMEVVVGAYFDGMAHLRGNEAPF